MKSANHESMTPRFRDETRYPATLKAHPANARIHSAAQVAAIVASIREFGFTRPIVIDEADVILAGHGGTLAALAIPLDSVPVRVVTGWTDEQKLTFLLADNKLGLLSSWDDELLAMSLGELAAGGADLALTGFGDDELAALLGPSEEAIDDARIERIETSTVADVFWIQISGPLADQAEILQQLHAVAADHPRIEVKLGTTPRDA